MPLIHSLVPLMLVAGVALGLPREQMERRAVQILVLAGLSLLFLRYYAWRLFETVLPANDLSVQSIFVWVLFLVETAAWFDAGVGYLALLRRTDRTLEADLHESRLRATPDSALPVIDVMIATVNEPIGVLEKTIIGALALDWPADRLRVWVLDDGRRGWLASYCARVGAGYLTREDNRDAKAGNINAAIRSTSGEFFLVLDADFVPQRNFLYRAMGFFQDPTIGIVQIPHNFFNSDPMQSNLDMHHVMPDDQRFFFDAIMPGRDGWDCAFCCGSNGVVRRSAMETIGNALPAGSITEDMLLTLALLRKGYRTRYLNERLALGLAPESLDAFFVQRARWARGAIQILYLGQGPFGPGLTPVQRLMFLPTHWISQTASQVVAMSTPAIYLLTGLQPVLNATAEEVIFYQLPAILASVITIRLFAPWQYFPLAQLVQSVLQAFRLLPTVVVTLLKPHGHAFRVTPKGSDASQDAADAPLMITTLGLVLLTALGLILNANPATRIVDASAIMPVVLFWSVLNMVVLLIVATTAVQRPARRSEERFDIELAGRMITAPTGSASAEARPLEVRTLDISLSGARVRLPTAESLVAGLQVSDWVALDLEDVGLIPAQIVRRTPTEGLGPALGLRFHLPQGPVRDNLIRRLFVTGLASRVVTRDAAGITLRMIRSIFRDSGRSSTSSVKRADPPPWIGAIEGTRDRRDAA